MLIHRSYLRHKDGRDTDSWVERFDKATGAIMGREYGRDPRNAHSWTATYGRAGKLKTVVYSQDPDDPRSCTVTYSKRGIPTRHYAGGPPLPHEVPKP